MRSDRADRAIRRRTGRIRVLGTGQRRRLGQSRLTGRAGIVIVALNGDSGKPRPAIVIQADGFDALSTVVVPPPTSTLADAPILRIDGAPGEANGLRVPSQIAVDRPRTVRHSKFGPTIGRLDNDVMRAVHRSLAVFLGLA